MLRANATHKATVGAPNSEEFLKKRAGSGECHATVQKIRHPAPSYCYELDLILINTAQNDGVIQSFVPVTLRAWVL